MDLSTDTDDGLGPNDLRAGAGGRVGDRIGDSGLSLCGAATNELLVREGKDQNVHGLSAERR